MAAVDYAGCQEKKTNKNSTFFHAENYNTSAARAASSERSVRSKKTCCWATIARLKRNRTLIWKTETASPPGEFPAACQSLFIGSCPSESEAVGDGRTPLERDQAAQGDNAQVLAHHVGRAVAHHDSARAGMEAVQVGLYQVGAVDRTGNRRARRSELRPIERRTPQLVPAVFHAAPAAAEIGR